jgi:SPOR domain
VAAVGNKLAAESAWRTLRGRHPDVLGPLPVSFDEVKVGEALLVRVQAGAFADRDAAARACSALRSGGTDCFVVGAQR